MEELFRKRSLGEGWLEVTVRLNRSSDTPDYEHTGRDAALSYMHWVLGSASGVALSFQLSELSQTLRSLWTYVHDCSCKCGMPIHRREGHFGKRNDQH